jgi:hypothetical protein
MSDLNGSTKHPSFKARVKSYFKHVWATFIEVPFTAGAWFYFVIVGLGVAAATWTIPSINGSETHAETLGIYVIGILVSVFADALFLWKKSKDDVIAESIAIVSCFLVVGAAYLSVKEDFYIAGGTPSKRWRHYAEFWLYLILMLSILMWAMINVVEPRLTVAATHEPAGYNNLSGTGK